MAENASDNASRLYRLLRTLEGFSSIRTMLLTVYIKA